MTSMPSVESIARELHDVVFAFGKPVQPFDDLPLETQGWFVERAERMIRLLFGEERA